MTSAREWARLIDLARVAAVTRDDHISAGFVDRAEAIVRDARLDALTEALRRTQRLMDAAPIRHRASVGMIVDLLSDMVLDEAGNQPRSGRR